MMNKVILTVVNVKLKILVLLLKGELGSPFDTLNLNIS